MQLCKDNKQRGYASELCRILFAGRFFYNELIPTYKVTDLIGWPNRISNHQKKNYEPYGKIKSLFGTTA
jgi:hypothetical protein